MSMNGTLDVHELQYKYLCVQRLNLKLRTDYAKDVAVAGRRDGAGGDDSKRDYVHICLCIFKRTIFSEKAAT